ncbi:MAG: PEP-CTERM sorting domain-containing protein [Planctomycetia bacterium]|nr:PEP-CTERM sorting domain-containing protein [Planctomycetia bacterium]
MRGGGSLENSCGGEFVWDGSKNAWDSAHWYIDGSAVPDVGSNTVRSSDTYTISSGEVSVATDLTANGLVSVLGGKMAGSGYWYVGLANGANPSTFLVDGGTVESTGKLVVGRNESSNNLFHLKNGTVTFNQIGITSGLGSRGKVLVEGGLLKVNDSLNISQADVGRMEVTGGEVQSNHLIVAKGNSTERANGTLVLSGGTIQTKTFSLAGTDDSTQTGTPDSATFLMSGGNVNVGGDFYMARTGRTSQLVITGGSLKTTGNWNSGTGTNEITFLGTDFSAQAGNYIAIQAGSTTTTHFMFADGGISTITAQGDIAWRQNIDLGIASGVTILDNSRHVLLKSGTVVRNVADNGSILDSSLWTLSGNGTKEYVATLDSNQKKGELAFVGKAFLDLSQTPSAKGFVELLDVPSEENWAIAFYFSENTSSDVGLDDLILWMNDADESLRTYYDVGASLTENGGILLTGLNSGSWLAWDFSDFNHFYDANFQVTGIGWQAVPEPASMWLLAGGILGFLAWGRFFKKRREP